MSNTSTDQSLRVTGPLAELSESQLDHFSDTMSASNPWLHFRYSRRECREKLSTPRLEFLVAASGEQDIGILAFAREGDLGGPFIRYVIVDPQRRSQGVGTALLQELIRRYPGQSLYLTVSESNPRAQQLYEQLGFVVIGSIPNYNLCGEDERILRLAGNPKREHSSM